MKAQRDTFISELYELAKTDKDIILMSVDMGAPSLDIWRETLPKQFIIAIKIILNLIIPKYIQLKTVITGWIVI
mgnify:CR=1 FL=1